MPGTHRHLAWWCLLLLAPAVVATADEEPRAPELLNDTLPSSVQRVPLALVDAPRPSRRHSDTQAVAPSGAAARWGTGMIPYAVDYNTLDVDAERWIRAAIGMWEGATCLRFYPCTLYDTCRAYGNDVIYVRGISSGAGGRVCAGGASVVIDIVARSGGTGERGIGGDGGACTTPRLLRALGLALGLQDEHLRNDRDRYVDVYTADATAAPAVMGRGARCIGAYDFASAMHPPPVDDSGVVVVTPEASAGTTPHRGGGGGAVSEGDARAVAYLYNTCRARYDAPVCTVNHARGAVLTVYVDDVLSRGRVVDGAPPSGMRLVEKVGYVWVEFNARHDAELTVTIETDLPRVGPRYDVRRDVATKAGGTGELHDVSVVLRYVPEAADAGAPGGGAAVIYSATARFTAPNGASCKESLSFDVRVRTPMLPPPPPTPAPNGLVMPELPEGGNANGSADADADGNNPQQLWAILIAAAGGGACCLVCLLVGWMAASQYCVRRPAEDYTPVAQAPHAHALSGSVGGGGLMELSDERDMLSTGALLLCAPTGLATTTECCDTPVGAAGGGMTSSVNNASFRTAPWMSTSGPPSPRGRKDRSSDPPRSPGVRPRTLTGAHSLPLSPAGRLQKASRSTLQISGERTPPPNFGSSGGNATGGGGGPGADPSGPTSERLSARRHSPLGVLAELAVAEAAAAAAAAQPQAPPSLPSPHAPRVRDLVARFNCGGADAGVAAAHPRRRASSRRRDSAAALLRTVEAEIEPESGDPLAFSGLKSPLVDGVCGGGSHRGSVHPPRSGSSGGVIRQEDLLGNLPAAERFDAPPRRQSLPVTARHSVVMARNPLDDYCSRALQAQGGEAGARQWSTRALSSDPFLDEDL